MHLGSGAAASTFWVALPRHTLEPAFSAAMIGQPLEIPRFQRYPSVRAEQLRARFERRDREESERVTV
jgi:hypothetical protein